MIRHLVSRKKIATALGALGALLATMGAAPAQASPDLGDDALEEQVQTLSGLLDLDPEQVARLRQILLEEAQGGALVASYPEYAPEEAVVDWQADPHCRARIEAALSAAQRVAFRQYREDCARRQAGYATPYEVPAVAPVYVAPSTVVPAPPAYFAPPRFVAPRRVVRQRFVVRGEFFGRRAGRVHPQHHWVRRGRGGFDQPIARRLERGHHFVARARTF